MKEVTADSDFAWAAPKRVVAWYVETTVYSVARTCAKLAATVILVVLPIAVHFLMLYSPQDILKLILLSLLSASMVPAMLLIGGLLQMAFGMRYKLREQYVSTPDRRYSWSWFRDYRVYDHPSLAGIRSVDLSVRTSNWSVTLYFDPAEVDESRILKILERSLPTTLSEHAADA